MKSHPGKWEKFSVATGQHSFNSNFSLKTQCGYQPLFQTSMNGFTVRKDVWSLNPFQNCFWNGQYVNFNDKTYTWIIGEWRFQMPSIQFDKPI